MKNFTIKIILGVLLTSFCFSSSAQCPVIDCPIDIISTNDSSMCDAVVIYSIPVVTDTCGLVNTQNFIYTGVQQTFTVPAGVSSITVDAYGAQGGSNSPSTNTNFGGHVHADIPVTPGTIIYVYVGEQPTGLTGGWNGGGNGETGGTGGGGASDIRIGGTAFSDRMIVAGGAGGGGLWSGQEVQGGLGGGLIGGTGYRSTITNIGGDPGTQISSGNGTCVTFDNPICAGGFGYGGAPSSCGCEGYGGGGGWYGGAGSGNCRGGGGGSSYTDPSTINVIHNQGVRIGHGAITISWMGSSTTPIISQIAGMASGSIFPVGTTVNTFVAENQGGLDTCSFLITVVDTEQPVISCSGSIEICEGESINGVPPSTSDNCIGETISYSLAGVTSGAGAGTIDTIMFNVGTTIVTYIVTDLAGNQDSCSFNVVVNPLPTVSLSSFAVDTICDYNQPIALPTGTPSSGVYSGAGVSGINFNPSLGNQGINWITYAYTDSTGCANSDSVSIYVDGCANLQEEGFLSKEISIYPNPTNRFVTISFENFDGVLDFTLSSLKGRIIIREMNYAKPSITIDLNDEPKGIYLINLNNGQTQRTLKFVKN